MKTCATLRLQTKLYMSYNFIYKLKQSFIVFELSRAKTFSAG